MEKRKGLQGDEKGGAGGAVKTNDRAELQVH